MNFNCWRSMQSIKFDWQEIANILYFLYSSELHQVPVCLRYKLKWMEKENKCWYFVCMVGK